MDQITDRNLAGYGADENLLTIEREQQIGVKGVRTGIVDFIISKNVPTNIVSRPKNKL